MNNNEDDERDTAGSSDGDDDDELSEGDTPESNVRRIRRSIECGAATSTPRWNPSTNPYSDNKVKLHSRTNHFLGVYADGTVRGTQDRMDLHTHLELVSMVGYPGHLRIKGLLTHQFVAINNKGNAYATPDVTDDNTVFIQGVKGFYQTYLSQQYAAQGWYLAIKKNGKMKNSKRTEDKQKAAQFLSVRKNQYFQY